MESNTCKYCGATFNDRMTFFQHVNSIHVIYEIGEDINDDGKTAPADLNDSEESSNMIINPLKRGLESYGCILRVEDVSNKSTSSTNLSDGPAINLTIKGRDEILPLDSKKDTKVSNYGYCISENNKIDSCEVIKSATCDEPDKYSIRDGLTEPLNLCIRDNVFCQDSCQKEVACKQDVKTLARKRTKLKSHKCEFCGKEYSSKRACDDHRRNHTGEKPYKCDRCGKGFTRKYKLDVHLRTHTGKKPYKCDTCGKEFSQKSHCDTHRRIHTGEKPYKCDLCGKEFSQKSNCDAHRRTHPGEKPYKCDVCGKEFARKDRLDVHLRTHTGKKAV